MKRRKLIWVALLSFPFVVTGLYQAWYAYEFPYGWSHSCDKGLYHALIDYADKHDGWFPQGEASPEASLSLVYREDPKLVDAEVLRGKSVPFAIVQQRLERGELLSPETCGWHYVEGLRLDDDPRLALFWDKAGLNHNGRRLRNGGRFVGTIGWDSKYIAGKDWPKFLAEQEQLRGKLKRDQPTPQPDEPN